MVDEKMKRRRLHGSILVIDDDKGVAETIGRVLSHAGLNVDLAMTPMEGIEKFSQKTYNVAFTDLKMPQMNGIKVIRELKDLNHAVPIIVLTGYGTIEGTVEALKAGAFGYLTKPCDNEKLLDVVETALEDWEEFREQKGLLHFASQRLTFRFPSKIKFVRGIIFYLVEMIARFGFEGENNSIRLALDEALVNAILHGNNGDPTKEVFVKCDVDREKVVIETTDQGEGFPHENFPAPITEDSLFNESGRGIFLINSFMDEVSFNEKGNTIRIVKYSPPQKKEIDVASGDQNGAGDRQKKTLIAK